MAEFQNERRIAATRSLQECKAMITRAMYFRNFETGEIAGAFDVTGQSERQIDRIERGMMINIGAGWCACDTEHAESVEAEKVLDQLRSAKL